MNANLAAAVALALTIPLTGCTQAGSQADTPVSRPNFADYDQSLVDDLAAKGVDGGAALFLASTKLAGQAVGKRGARITESFPTGNKAVLDVTITPGTVGDPATLEATSRVTDKGLTFSLKYLVPADAVPADVRSTINLAIADHAAKPVVLISQVAAVAAVGPEPTVYEVLVQGLVEKFVDSKVSDFAEYLDKKYTKGVADPLLNVLQAGLSVQDALALGDELDALKSQIDALEECAKNPTNPLTKKKNNENPADLERILKQIEATRAEVTGNTAVSFLGLLNETAAGAIKGVPWLAYVLGHGTAWSQDTMRKVNQELIDDLTKAIPSCDNDLKIDADFEGLWHLSAIKCDGPVGKWEIRGVVIGGNGLSGEEDITATLAGASLSGPWASNGIVRTPGATREFNESGIATYTAASDKKSGRLDFAPGSVPVTAGKFCKEAEPAT
jgi:hypothetical protein